MPVCCSTLAIESKPGPNGHVMIWCLVFTGLIALAFIDLYQFQIDNTSLVQTVQRYWQQSQRTAQLLRQVEQTVQQLYVDPNHPNYMNQPGFTRRFKQTLQNMQKFNWRGNHSWHLNKNQSALIECFHHSVLTQITPNVSIYYFRITVRQTLDKQAPMMQQSLYAKLQVAPLTRVQKKQLHEQAIRLGRISWTALP